MRKLILVCTILIIADLSKGQEIYVPNGTIGTSSSNKNIGIGTPDPNSKLDLKVPYNINQDEELRIGFYPDNDNNKYYGFGLNFKVDANGWPTKHIVDYHDGAKYYPMTFNQGNIGISRTTPNAKLDIGVPYNKNQDEELRIGFYPENDNNKYYGFGLNFKVDANGWPTKHIVDYHDGAKYYSMTFNQGNIGISRTTPNAKLDIGVPYNKNQDEELRIGFYPENDNNKYYGFGLNFKVDANGWPTKHIVDYHDGAKYYSMTFNQGNIGISRTKPNAKLDIGVPYSKNQDEELRIGFYPENDNNKYYGFGLNFKVDGNGMPTKHIVNYHDGIKYYSISFKKGNVGIGTTEPGDYKLAVEGTIGAREVKVTLDNWSDFVFDSEYKLKDLEDVENYINDNKRLPDIPSESEVIANGVNLGEMNAKLLQKIEELTLYLIEQNKILKANQEEISNLKDEIKHLK
jgi:uncharacterized protein YbgA (DUF1722 family)